MDQPAKQYKDWQVRVLTEKEELDSKIVKLEHFVNSNAFENLDFKNRTLLSEQLKLMIEYSLVLNQRIKLF